MPVSPDNPDQMLAAVLPPALEVMTAWSLAEGGEPGQFHQAMQRVLADATRADEPLRELSQFLFGLSALGGILLDELAETTGRTREQVLQALHHRYLQQPSTR